jgi:competence protein ComEA
MSCPQAGTIESRNQPTKGVFQMSKHKLLIIASFALIFVAYPLAGMGKPSAQPKKQSTKIIMGLININTASLVELIQLPGIGVNRAEKIIAYRESRQFRSPADIMRIKGIGPKMYQRLAAHITVSMPTKLTLVQRPLVSQKK